jgi:choline dehydrogenase-like flavoprotein
MRVLAEELRPGAHVRDDAALRAYVREFSTTCYHPVYDGGGGLTAEVGTCRMAATAREGVVGGDLVVFGTSNLMVADASVMPSVGLIGGGSDV